MKLPLYKVLSLLRRSFAFDNPHHIQWMLTRRCNYRCKSCGVWQDKKLVEELSTEKVKEGLNVLRKMGAIELVFSGGNPLLREDIGEIIEYASRYFITTVYDNGSQAAKKVDALRKADFVAISLDTLNEEKYDYLKGVKGALKNALNSIQTLHNHGITVAVSPTISQLNMYEIIDFTEYFAEKQIPVLYCLYQHDPLAESLFQIGEENRELEIVDRKGMAELCDALNKKKDEYPGVLITRKALNALKGLYLNGRRTWKCQALQSFMAINPQGKVAGCHLQNPVASIFELPTLWNSQAFENLRKTYSECEKCSYMCYMFYSIHANVQGNIEVIRDQWRNAETLLTH